MDAQPAPLVAPVTPSADGPPPRAAADAPTALPSGDGTAVPKTAAAPTEGASTDLSALIESGCTAVVGQTSLMLKRDQCGDFAVNIVANLAYEIPTVIVAALVAVWKLWSWSRRRRAARTARTPATATAPESSPLDSETFTRLRGVLLDLPRWKEQSRARRNFLTIALGKGDPVLDLIDWGGSARDVAHSVVSACAEHAGTDGTPPLCALLAAIPREFGAKPARDQEIAALRALLGCP